MNAANKLIATLLNTKVQAIAQHRAALTELRAAQEAEDPNHAVVAGLLGNVNEAAEAVRESKEQLKQAYRDAARQQQGQEQPTKAEQAFLLALNEFKARIAAIQGGAA